MAWSGEHEGQLHEGKGTEGGRALALQAQRQATLLVLLMMPPPPLDADPEPAEPPPEPEEGGGTPCASSGKVGNRSGIGDLELTNR
jgi:hypothetical protein